MADRTESALDDRLRRVARRAVDDASASVEIEAALAQVHGQLGDVPAVTRSNARTPGQWLGAAAAVAFLSAGIVVVVASQDDDNIQISGPSTSVVAVPTSSAVPVAPGTTGSATTIPTTSTTAPGAEALALASAFPAVAAPLQLVSVTASETVATCFTSPTAFAVVEGSALRQVGTVGVDGALSPDTSPVAGCDGVPPNVDHADVRIPPTLQPGDYVICLAGLDVAPGCAAVTVDAWAETCFDAPIAPPGLTDGSQPGEPVADGDIVTWGSGRVSVSQVVGARPDQTWVSPSGGSRAGSYEVLPGSEPGANVLSIIGGVEFCPRRYLVSAELQSPELRVLSRGWLAFLADGTPVPTDRHEELLAPAEYFGMRFYSVGDQGVTEVRRFAPDGSDLGQVDPSDLFATPPGVELDDGRRVRFDPAAPPDARCLNRPLQIEDGAGGQALHPDLAEAFTFASTTSGVVVATRNLCPDGAAWGEPGTSSQTVVLDIGRPDAGVTVLLEDAGVAGPLGGRSVAWISPDGRFVGLAEPVSAEATRDTMIDLAAPDVPIELPSGCPNATSIASFPEFVDGSMFIARACPSGTQHFVTVDQLTLPDLSLVWSATVDRELLAYCGCADLSVGPGPVPSVIITGSASVEVPNTSVLVVGDQQTEITHLGFAALSFTLPELPPPT